MKNMDHVLMCADPRSTIKHATKKSCCDLEQLGNRRDTAPHHRWRTSFLRRFAVKTLFILPLNPLTRFDTYGPLAAVNPRPWFLTERVYA